MHDKVMLITGATAGIGRAAAHALAATGATLVCAARNEEKARELVAELQEKSGNQEISYLIGDLSRPAEVRKLAQAFQEQHQRLDVLFNNAGAYFVSRALTEDGLERTFAVNHMAYFVLTTELLDLLQASAPSRVVSTSSDAHGQAGLDYLDDLQSERWGASGLRAYAGSKLANIWFTAELGKRLEGTGVLVNCFHPGFVASSFAKNNGFLAKMVMTLTRPFQRNVTRGAETGVWLATSPEVGEETGGYWFDKRRKKGTRAARNPDAPARLWAESERILAEVLGS